MYTTERYWMFLAQYIMNVVSHETITPNYIIITVEPQSTM